MTMRRLINFVAVAVSLMSLLIPVLTLPMDATAAPAPTPTPTAQNKPKPLDANPKVLDNPSTLWVKQFGSSSGDGAYGVAVDTSGDIFVGGYTDGVLPGQTSAGGRDGFLSKYDSSRNLLWTRQLGTSGSDYVYGVAADAVGNVFIAGNTSGTLPGMSSSGGTDGFIRKYNSAGSEVWTQQWGTTDTDYPAHIALDGSGNIFVGGETYGVFSGQASSGGVDVFVSKLNSSGTVLWTRQFGTSSTDYLDGLTADTSGNIYVSGTVYATLSGQTSSGGNDAFMRKYDTSGNALWTRQFGTSANDTGRGIGLDSSGNIYVSGTTEGTFPGQSSSGYIDIFLRKHDSSGNEIWTRQLGSNGNDYSNGLALDSSGNVYLAGHTQGALPGQTPLGSLDGYALKYDGSGNVLWIRQFGTSGGEYAWSLALHSSGNLYIAGSTDSTFTGETSAGFDDAYLFRLGYAFSPTPTPSPAPTSTPTPSPTPTPTPTPGPTPTPITPFPTVTTTPTPSIQAIPGFAQSVSFDGTARLDVRINRVRNPNTDANVMAPGGIAAYYFTLSYPGGGTGNAVNILNAEGVSPFLPASFNILNATGTTRVSAFQVEAAPQAPITLARVAPRILGSSGVSHDIVLSFTNLLDGTDGSNIPQDSSRTFTVRRGDARNDGVINIADALFIAQYLAGLRGPGETTSLVHVVNAASIKTDNPTGDQVTISDALLVAQMVVGLRDDSFN